VPPLASLSDQSAQALAADQIYRTVSRTALSSHPWSFALREIELAKLVLSEAARRNSKFQYAYQLPLDCLRVLGLRSYHEYRLAGDQLYTDDKAASVIYVANVSESAWPSYFVKHVSMAFAAAVAISLTENVSRAELMYSISDDALRKARSTDSLQTPPHVFDMMRVYMRRTHNPLASA